MIKHQEGVSAVSMCDTLLITLYATMFVSIIFLHIRGINTFKQ